MGCAQRSLLGYDVGMVLSDPTLAEAVSRSVKLCVK
jgi:hypothetical protein